MLAAHAGCVWKGRRTALENREFWLWLVNLPRIYSSKINKLLDRFGSVEHIYRAEEKEYYGIDGIGKTEIASLLNKDLSKAKEIQDKVEKLGAYILCYDDAEYPAMLRESFDPPYVLYVLGERLDWSSMLPVSVVGSRENSEYGMHMTQEICYELAQHGVTVVSGMARGIDSVAHRSALRAGAKTIAFLGCGIDVVYPPENADLMKAIAENGAVMTEFAPGTPPYGKNFPVRNRLIAGFSRGLLVVEAKRKSGTWSTANWALENGKDIFAVPGDCRNENSKGCHFLIKSGAKLTECAEDILEEYYYDLSRMGRIEIGEPVVVEKAAAPVRRRKPAVEAPPEPVKMKPELDDARFDHLDEGQKKIIALLIQRDAHIDEICRKASLSASEAGAALTLMELEGLVAALAGKMYTLNV